MKQDEAKRIIQDCLENTYNSINFDRLIANILTTPYQIINNKVWEAYVREAFRDSISSYVVKGIYEDSSSKKIAILEVQLRSDTSLQHARTMQRNFVADFLKGGNNYGRQDGALVAFVWPEGHDWRFSLVKMEYSLEVKEGKIKTQENLTPAKRWSFLVGKNEKSHTAQSRFLPLVMEESHGAVFAEIENAFDVESVTDEFFEQYKECFFRFKDEIDRVIALNESDRAHFESIGLDTANFAKKTLGQIAFLYFLQKKWWFGVASDKKWWEWPKDFLRKLFERREKYGKNFFNDVLEPLFYEALATDRWELAIYTRLNNTRVPFLNGGLFEPMKGYEWEKTDLTINDEVFSNDHKTKNGDIGDGIFDVFDRYNFTVSEDEPLEKEVAVDPEMLGKIFENLLEIRDRKSKWAFYTPRPIVHYMCQESLIEYLSNIDISIARDDIEFFIRESEVTLENDKTTKRKIEESKEKWREYRGDYAYKTPASIREKAKELDQALSDIRIADPAVGSGAFPLGMINEIVRARQILAVHAGSKITTYQLKLHAIQENIYGVDLEPGAVEICQLRLWLSLIVDETVPHPLPNLNYRIMQGNSLIEEYEWIKLYDNKLLSSEKPKKAEQSNIFSLEDSESNKLYTLLQVKLKRFIETSGRTEKNALKQEIDELKFWLIEATLQEQWKQEKISEIRRLREANITPFFLWKLEFSEVFQEKGGFDVVIGNPPYVQLQKFARTQIQKDLENANYQTFTKNGDLYCLFYERWLEITRKWSGVLCYITSNKWMRAGYGEKLREYFINKNPLKLLDLWSNVFDSATVDSNILLIQNAPNKESTLALTVKNHSEDLSAQMKNLTPTHFTESSGWFIGSSYEITLKTKIEKIGKPLKEWNLNISMWIKSGLKEAFEVDKIFYENAMQIDPCYKEVIKPILHWREIWFYEINTKEKYLIFALRNFQLDKFPLIREHLLWFRSSLEARATASTHAWCELQQPQMGIYREFEKERIVYPDISQKSSFSLCPAWTYQDNTTYSINTNSRYILGLLNSKLILYYYRFIANTMGEKAVRFFTQYVEMIPIIDLKNDDPDREEIENLVGKIIELKKNNEWIGVWDLVKEIDNITYKLYGLTEEEIKIVEGK